MNYNNNDVIIAQSTPIGSAALAMVRVSGSDLSCFVSNIIKNKTIKSRYSYTVEFQGFQSKQLIDTCVIVYYKAPKSFTGEDMLEISCHGNDLIVEQIINEFIGRGVRIAYPGEFSYRAFQNNKLDLMQAESIAAKITTNSNAYGVALQNIENGSFSKKINLLKSSLLNILSIIEHELDFNEDEITHLGLEKIKSKLEKIKNDLSVILACSSMIKKINDGYKVVILGPPNVGKSTLFNKILGVDRAIVSPIKGTTRDIVEAKIKIKNVPFSFYDTAGYRSTKDLVEGLGIKKGLELVKCADMVLVVDEACPKKTKLQLIDRGVLNKAQKLLCVQTKCDNLKGNVKVESNTIKLSAKHNVGINQLLTYLFTYVSGSIEKTTHNSLGACNTRQISLLDRAEKNIRLILSDIDQGCSMDIVASGCRGCVSIIEDLVGKVSSTEVLNNIFKGFCVGK